MASNPNETLLKCSMCQKELTLTSKTSPCLHSFCRSCLDIHFKEETDGNLQCPVCKEPLTPNQLKLSPSLAKILKLKPLDSIKWNCFPCLKEDKESTAKHWCHECHDLYCDMCIEMHKKFQMGYSEKHTFQTLDGIGIVDLIKVLMEEKCSLHWKVKDLYCRQCNVCLCDACYKIHSAGPPKCSCQPVDVKKAASERRSQGPALTKEIKDLKRSLKGQIERVRTYTERLNSDCKSKCVKLWSDSIEMIENIKQKTSDLCNEISEIAEGQLKRWRPILQENERNLKELESWCLNLDTWLSESKPDIDVVCELGKLESKLSPLRHKSVGPEEEYQSGPTFPEWWLQALEQLKTASVSLSPVNIIIEKEWNLPKSTSVITSIHVSKEDDHVFICDYKNTSIVEFTEGGEFVCNCPLFQRTEKFHPFDVCQITSDTFIVACGYEKKIISLRRRKEPPLLQIIEVITTEDRLYSVCQINESIFVCDDYFKVYSITKTGQKIKTIQIGGKLQSVFPNRIRFDPFRQFIWATELNQSALFSFTLNGNRIQSMKTEEEITDVCVNEFGDSYMCNCTGIFSLSTKKVLYKFEKESINPPAMFILKDKIFVYHGIDKKGLIKIFKI